MLDSTVLMAHEHHEHPLLPLLPDAGLMASLAAGHTGLSAPATRHGAANQRAVRHGTTQPPRHVKANRGSIEYSEYI